MNVECENMHKKVFYGARDESMRKPLNFKIHTFDLLEWFNFMDVIKILPIFKAVQITA